MDRLYDLRPVCMASDDTHTFRVWVYVRETFGRCRQDSGLAAAKSAG